MKTNLRQQRKNVRRWGLLWRLMKQRRDKLGQQFALERATLWRNYVNRMEKI